MLYSKLGSIPKPETDGTDGWIEVPEPPVAPEGMEVVWWFPPGWVVRPVMPAPVDGHCWSWSQSEAKWILCADRHVDSNHVEPVIDLGSANDTISLTTSGETISGGV